MQYRKIEFEDFKNSIACYLRAAVFKQTDQKEYHPQKQSRQPEIKAEQAGSRHVAFAS